MLIIVNIDVDIRNNKFFSTKCISQIRSKNTYLNVKYYQKKVKVFSIFFQANSPLNNSAGEKGYSITVSLFNAGGGNLGSGTFTDAKSLIFIFCP